MPEMDAKIIKLSTHITMISLNVYVQHGTFSVRSKNPLFMLALFVIIMHIGISSTHVTLNRAVATRRDALRLKLSGFTAEYLKVVIRGLCFVHKSGTDADGQKMSSEGISASIAVANMCDLSLWLLISSLNPSLILGPRCS